MPELLLLPAGAAATRLFPAGTPTQVWTMRPDGSQATLRTTDPDWSDGLNPTWLLRRP